MLMVNKFTKAKMSEFKAGLLTDSLNDLARKSNNVKSPN